ncbi:spermatogenesis-associated protein 17-like [Physella acuta]|uniref:spermatogenesis-associated protein 17-like n=1 Tax=Physella acuta TaxID=109671 RepID=UPI0027DBDA69|nr:spermatogenesis-associated protein 17-like [Physella acuta]
MAAMIRLAGEINTLIAGVYDKKNVAEVVRQKEYAAAVKIQSWFRGSRVRFYLKHLNHSATIIQKTWRGYLGRKFCRILVKNTLFIIKLNYYNGMACKIQRTWRGYYARKYVFNYFSRKRYLEALQVKNELIRSELADFAEQQLAARKREEEKSAKQRKAYEARKQHHLVSTYVIPGVYNSPFLLYPTEMEFLLRNAQPLSHKKKKTNKCKFDPSCSSYSSLVPKTLPPLIKKPKGPFREPEEVQKQRYKPFQPSLRVATDFYSLEKARKKMKDEEWVTRLNDNILQPFTHRFVPYEPLLHTTTKFGHIDYGTKFFRERCVEKFLSPQDFKSQVPPIPVFDKFNDTYSCGQY